MSKAEIIAELSHLCPEDLAEVQAKLDELASTTWQDEGELSESDKLALEEALAGIEKTPDAGSSWDDVKRRIQASWQTMPEVICERGNT